MDQKKPKVVRATAPEAYLYTPPKKDKKVTDKDLFILPSNKREKYNKK